MFNHSTRRSLFTSTFFVVLLLCSALGLRSTASAVPVVVPVPCTPITVAPGADGVYRQNIGCWYKIINDNAPLAYVITFRMVYPPQWGLNFAPAVGGVNAPFMQAPVFIPAQNYYAFQLIRPPRYYPIAAGLTQIDIGFNVAGRCGEVQQLYANYQWDWDVNAATFGQELTIPNIVVRFPACKRCNNKIDDDGDGKIDLADPGCAGPNDDDEFNYVPKCSNGRDDDGDGLIDQNDPGCSGPNDDDEFNRIPACSNGQDDDGDWKIDMNDPGCTGPDDDDETNAPPPPPDCSNGRDDDGDWKIDMADPGCSGPNDNDETDAPPPPTNTACSNGLDDDADWLTDLDDPGCANASDNDEVDGTPACSNGRDDDGDGLADEGDPGCYAAYDNDEFNHIPACQNGKDDDKDWLVDCYDPGCSDGEDDDEVNNANLQTGVRRVAGLLADRTKLAARYAKRSATSKARSSKRRNPVAALANRVIRGADQFVGNVEGLSGDLSENTESACEVSRNKPTLDALRDQYAGQGLALESLNTGSATRRSKRAALLELIRDGKVAMQQGMWLVDAGSDPESACK